MIKVALDCLGGDHGSAPIIEGAIKALKEKSDFKLFLVGDEEEIKISVPEELRSRCEVIHTEEFISMEAPSTEALRRKNSSIYMCMELLRERKVDAVVSAGHSGATMSLATLRVGRIEGITRPAIATYLPQIDGSRALLLDAGANMDCKPEHLVQFAILGREYAKDIIKKPNPRVGLVSIGSEKSKGDDLTKETYEMLEGSDGFIGNVEGNDLFSAKVDVIVCDGFVGNVILKTGEGIGEAIGAIIKQKTKKSFFAIMGAVLMKKIFNELKKDIDYAEYGGAPLLGVNGCVIIGHGKSNSKAIKNAIFQAYTMVNSGYVDHARSKVG
jgi:glycerol-3-phosphate acyltransferase PlsX